MTETVDFREAVRGDYFRERSRDEAARQTMLEWSDLVPERGTKLAFRFFPYQREWYSEEIARAREVVWMKAAQVGMSAYAWRWGARRCDAFGDRVIYFFPTDVHVREFGDTRMEPSIRSSDYLLGRIPASHVHQKGLKQIGAGFLSLRGLQSSLAVQSVDADALVFDEYDLSDLANLGQAERRLAGAKAAGRDPRIRRLGYPTIPDSGIHALFERSQKRRWYVTCAACGAEQTIDFEPNLRWRNEGDDRILRAGSDEFEIGDDVEAWRACRECEATLEGDDGPMYSGRWIADRPDARVIGFHVPRLIVPRTDLAEIVLNSRKTSPSDVESHFTLDRGLPYLSSETALTERDILAACTYGLEELPSGRTNRFVYTAGLDVASERDLNLVIDQHLPDGTRQAVYTGEPIDFKEAGEIIDRFGVNLTVVDSMPERRQARALAATFPGRVVLCWYDETTPRADAYRLDPKKNVVAVNRTEAIDAMMDSIRQHRKAPPRYPPKRYVDQLRAPKRRTVEDTKGRPVRVYVSTGTVGDDYAHAEVYALVASEVWKGLQLMDAESRAAMGEPIADEDLGFRRAKLDVASDDYDPGLSEWDR